MSSRTHTLVFKMINAGEFTPDEALEEATRLHQLAPNYFQDTINMLICWAWEKKDEAEREIERMWQRVRDAEVCTGRMMTNAVRIAKINALRATSTFTGEEPF